MSRIVVIGAGMVGRGLIGELFATAGWDVHFLDVAQVVIATLAQDGGYRHIVVGNDGESETWVGHVTASLSTDANAVDHVVAADLVATAVGANVLPRLAGLLVDAQRRRPDRPVNVLLCENLHDADKVLREAVVAIDADAGAQLGLVRTSIGRMIPVTAPGEPTTEVRVEAYGFLPVDAAAMRSPVPLPRRVIVDPSVPFSFYADRKLYVHNMGHFLAGLLGATRGEKYLWQAMESAEVREIVQAAMTQSAAALAQHYHQPVGPLLLHAEDLRERFRNRALGDTIDRVVRDPQRKLADGDRVQGALALCAEEGVAAPHITLAAQLGRAYAAGELWTSDQVSAALASLRREMLSQPVV